MLDKKIVLEESDRVKANLAKRGLVGTVNVDEIIAKEGRRRELEHEINGLRERINQISSRGKEVSDGEKSEARAVKARIGTLQTEVDEAADAVYQLMLWLPNFVDERVPLGGEENNQTLRTVGEPRSFDFKPKSHFELGVDLEVMDFERGAKIAGPRFYFLKNELVRMRRALTEMFVSHLEEHGFTPVAPPLMVKERTLYGTGYLPFAKKANFKIEDEDLTLIGTSEQPLVTQHMDETLNADDLPLKYVGESECFRTEAGSYGRDTRGLMRVHQFFKTEQIVFCAPEDSEEWHQKTLANEEWILKELGIPYRVVLTAAEDLAPFGNIKYDIEAWIPSQEKYREMTSNTNMLDYQTRRSNIRAKNKKGKKFFPHTISATGFPDRLMIAIMENYQRSDGSIEIPEKLRPFMRGLEEIRR